MIPADLTKLRQWCIWSQVNGSKMPMTPTGGTFRSNDPQTFASFEEAKSASDNVAFVIQESDPYTGIDLDNCLDDKGNLKPWASPIVMRLDGVAYAEISPSGKGIKFITQGKKLKGARCVRSFGGEKQQVEVYDFNRFWTITSNVYANNCIIGDGQAAVDWLCETYLTDGNLRDFKLSDATQTALPIDERAKRYADNADLPKEGGRNNAAFRLSGHLFAMEDANGNRLTESSVIDLLHSWNRRLPEPLSETEVEKVVKSAASNGIKRETKKSIEPVRHVENVPTKPRLEKDLLRPPGMISDIIDYTLRTSLYPQPELAFAGAISLMAAITGRKLTDTYGTRTNVYVLGLAPSGSGKEQARKTNKVILQHAGGDEYIGPERIGSSAGMTVQIANHPAILFQLDEIGRLMATLKNPGKSAHLYNIATVLMQIYGSSDSMWIGDAYADVKRVPKINQPHAVIYGTSVPANFWENLTAENVTDGLLGRMMPFESQAGYVDPQNPELGDPDGGLIESVRYWIDLKCGGNLHDSNPEPVVAGYSPEAKERFESHMLDIAKKRKKDDERSAALWSRSAGKAGKLALIFAASRAPRTSFFRVELEDIDRAIKVSNWITRTIQERVLDHVSENEFEEKTKRVLRMLEQPLTKSQLTRKTQFLRKRERDEIVETLIESGLVECETRQDSETGRVSTSFRRLLNSA